jgi:hypothetical protein
MKSAASTLPSSVWLRRLDLLVPLLAFAVFAGLGVKFLQFRAKSDWDDVYLRAATYIADQGPLYIEFKLYTYPPFMAWLSIPFTMLPPVPSRLLWFAVNVFCFVGMVRIAWRWAYPADSERDLSDADRWKRWAVFAFGLLLGGRAMTNCMLHHQTDLVVGFLVFWGVDLLLRSRPNAAAVSIGLAAALKCTPLLWMAYFLWTGPRRAALLVAATAVSANLLPDITHPAPSGTWFSSWIGDILFNTLEPNKYPGQWNVDVMTNQSLAGSLFAWIISTWSWETGGLQLHYRQPPLTSPKIAKLIVYGIGSFLMLMSFLRMRFAGWKAKASSTPNVLDACMILCLMLLLSPMSHKTHFGLLLAPGFVLGRTWMEQRSPMLTAVLGLALLLQIVSLRAISAPLAGLASWYGAQMFTTMGLLGGCWIARSPRRVAEIQVEPMAFRRAA